MILFLDFDGVLRRKQAPLYKLEPELVDRLCELLRKYPKVDVVITSSWTDAFSMKKIKALFPDDIAARIVGKTARLAQQVDYSRYKEIKSYIRKKGGNQEWVALDDDPLYYPPGVHVVLVDPVIGLNVQKVVELKRYFT